MRSMGVHMQIFSCTLSGSLIVCRWDLQRARALLEHQELLKKYNKKSGGAEPMAEKKKEKVVSFLSKLEDGMKLH